MKMKNKGFTLIELLVVMVVIGILAGLTLTGFAAAKKNARDATRKSDINQYRNGLEEYAVTHNGLFPVYGDVTQVTVVCATDLSEFLQGCTLDDPLAASGKHYYYQSNGTDYVLYADLETAGWWYACSGGAIGIRSQTSEPWLGICT